MWGVQLGWGVTHTLLEVEPQEDWAEGTLGQSVGESVCSHTPRTSRGDPLARHVGNGGCDSLLPRGWWERACRKEGAISKEVNTSPFMAAVFITGISQEQLLIAPEHGGAFQPLGLSQCRLCSQQCGGQDPGSQECQPGGHLPVGTVRTS